MNPVRAAAAFTEQIRALARSALQDKPKQMSLDEFREHIRSILARDMQLAEVTVLPDLSVRFEFEDITYLITFEPNDPKFMTLQAGWFYRVDGAAELAAAYKAANDTVRNTKAVKVWLEQVEDGTWFAADIEMFLPSFDAVDKVWIKRLLSALRFGLSSVVERMDSGLRSK